jgi:hypothetical protein
MHIGAREWCTADPGSPRDRHGEVRAPSFEARAREERALAPQDDGARLEPWRSRVCSAARPGFHAQSLIFRPRCAARGTR